MISTSLPTLHDPGEKKQTYVLDIYVVLKSKDNIFTFLICPFERPYEGDLFLTVYRSCCLCHGRGAIEDKAI